MFTDCHCKGMLGRFSKDQLMGMEENSGRLAASGRKVSGDWWRIMYVCNLLISLMKKKKKQHMPNEITKDLSSICKYHFNYLSRMWIGSCFFFFFLRYTIANELNNLILCHKTTVFCIRGTSLLHFLKTCIL